MTRTVLNFTIFVVLVFMLFLPEIVKDWALLWFALVAAIAMRIWLAWRG